MGVVFDEVVTQIEAPPLPPQGAPGSVMEAPSPQNEARHWQQQQAVFWRRQQRLEAD